MERSKSKMGKEGNKKKKLKWSENAYKDLADFFSIMWPENSLNRRVICLKFLKHMVRNMYKNVEKIGFCDIELKKFFIHKA